jgi:hypothetical protein
VQHDGVVLERRRPPVHHLVEMHEVALASGLYVNALAIGTTRTSASMSFCNARLAPVFANPVDSPARRFTPSLRFTCRPAT